jgi:NAD-dependent deacetylase
MEFQPKANPSESRRVVVLTGAGVSQESGIPTFRGNEGLWEGQRWEDVATPQAFRLDPQRVHHFYNMRRRQLQEVTVHPNACHFALAKWEAALPPHQFLLITQNVDDLHERAGSRNLIHLHGELLKARCLDTGELFAWRDDLTVDTPHPRDPDRRGRLRPHIVWFGELPLALPRIEAALQACDLFVAIGTSGNVYPAAAFVQWVPARCRKVEINLEDTPVASEFDEVIRGSAAVEVPKYVSEL